MKVSVIAPVFKVGKFIERCTRSLMEQTLDDVEFIFVDDCSPDDSIDIVRRVIAEYPSRNVRILRHEVNQGLPCARNTGLAAATGDFIFHCDSDDFIEKDMLEKMYDAAIRNDADYVYCDFFLSFATNERYMSNVDYASPDDMLRNGFLSGATKFNVWNKMTRRSLYGDGAVSFPGGHAMGEDMTMILLLMSAKKVVHVKEALYHYVQLNTGAYSKTFSPKLQADIKFNVARVEQALAAYPDIEKYLAFFKLNNKLTFIISDKRRDYMIWKEWYPEANAFIMENKSLPFRTRLLQKMAAMGQWWYVWLYNKLVLQFIYGVIFK